VTTEKTGPFDGRAKWIWSAEGVARPRPDAGPYRVRYFRREFEAPAGASLTVHASADSRYVLWCNGRVVARGPAKGDVEHTFYDTIDVTEHLAAGPNVLAAQVEYYGDVFCNYTEGGAPVSQMTAAPGFVLDGVLRGADGGEIEPVGTDPRWRVLIDTAHRHQIDATYSHCIGMLEDLDCSAYPWGFTEAGFDDSAWAPAREAGSALTLDADRDDYMPHRLLPRMIAPLEVSVPRPFAAAFRAVDEAPGGLLDAFSATVAVGAQATVPARTRVAVLLDVGELTTAYPRLTFSGGAGATIRLRYAEALTDEAGQKSRRDDLAFGDIRGYGDVVRPDGPKRTYQPQFWRTFRFVRVEIATAEQPVTIHALQYAFTAYPFRALAEVATSDPDVEAIWDVSWRTARLCAHETYEDCPYYEQLQYGGDTQVQAMVSYVVAADASLARQWLVQFDWSRLPEGLTRSRYPSRVPQIIPLFSLHWVMAIHDYWMHTGDAATVGALWCGVRAVLDYFSRHRNDDGTVGRMPGWMYADWSPQWLSRTGPSGCPPGAMAGRSAFVSLITINALDAAADLATAAGADAAEFARQADDLRTATHRAYYDPDRRLYRDAPDGDVASAYTNVRAILANMPCDHPALAERVVGGDGLCELTYFSTYFAWRALAAAGRYDLMGRLLGPWRAMLAEALTTWKEDPRGDRSDCHAWGCGPMVEYCREILGVRPIEPGYAVIGIEPKPAGLSFARGRVPLTRLAGDRPVRFVGVDWRIESGRFILAAQSPDGIPCRVRLPDGNARQFPRGGEIRLEGAAPPGARGPTHGP